jgi:hypothetical protein
MRTLWRIYGGLMVLEEFVLGSSGYEFFYGVASTVGKLSIP